MLARNGFLVTHASELLYIPKVISKDTRYTSTPFDDSQIANWYLQGQCPSGRDLPKDNHAMRCAKKRHCHPSLAE
eukprot:7012303-Pyramimonas_sp.AAC.1